MVTDVRFQYATPLHKIDTEGHNHVVKGGEVSVTRVDSLINCVKFTLWHRSCKATASRECGFSISQFSSDDDIFPECKRLRILVHKVINKTGHRTIFGPISYTENDGS